MENYIKVNNTDLWTEVSGNNIYGYIFLCSGGPGCCDYLLPVAKMLEDNFCVIRFEQRGCGRSDKDSNYDLMTTIDDIEYIRKYYDIDKWIVGGHSWGANLALIYSLKYTQNVQKILYIAGNGFQNNREWSMQYHYNLEKHKETLPEMRYPINVDVNKTGNATFRKYIQSPSLYRQLNNFELKTLFMCAENDIRPNWPVLQLYNLLPNAELTIIERAEHYIWINEYEAMKDALLNFLL